MIRSNVLKAGTRLRLTTTMPSGASSTSGLASRCPFDEDPYPIRSAQLPAADGPRRIRWSGPGGRSASVQSGARRDGIAGIYGNPGIVESVTYRI